MKKTEIYTYTRIELEANKVITSTNENNDIKYITENTIGNVYLPNSTIKYGRISYINNLFIDKEISFNTSIGTFITKDGSIVFNLNYILKFRDSKPDIDKVLFAQPTFMSGKYMNYKNLTITIQILELTGDRIIAIEYFE
jgi:hypothetical protein